MLGIILLYWVGKYFYKLAEKYGKSKWGFAILGIVVYYVGFFFFGIIMVFIAEMISEGFVDETSDAALGLLALPFGVLTCYLFYKYLKSIWKQNDPSKNNSIDEIGKK